MAANVPMIDMGSARLGIMVAETLRRKRKITSTTSADGQHQGELARRSPIRGSIRSGRRGCPD